MILSMLSGLDYMIEGTRRGLHGLQVLYKASFDFVFLSLRDCTDIQDLTLVVISYEIYETSLRRVS